MHSLRPAVAIALALALVALGTAGRLLPHVPNFTPAASIALFAGFLFARRSTAALVTVAAMLASDLVVGFYEPMIMVAVYGAVLVPLAFRGWLRAKLAPERLLLAAAGSSLAFFAVTNLAVWRHWYDPTFAGLAECYAAALPFLKYTMGGDLVWTFGLFGAWSLARSWTRAGQRPRPGRLATIPIEERVSPWGRRP